MSAGMALEPAGRKPWTANRIASLGFLMGQGLTASEIAPHVSTTPNNVQRHAQRFGLSFRTSRGDRPRRTRLEQAAAQRGMTLAELEAKLLSVIDAEPNLVDAVLDDLEPAA